MEFIIPWNITVPKGTNLLSAYNEEGANPSVDTVKRLIKYFEISFEELYP